MRSRFEDPHPRSKIIDLDVTDVTQVSHVSDAEQPEPPLPPQDFRHRHGLKILGAVMVVMFTVVIIAQVGC